MAAYPTTGDVKSLNKLARQIKSQPAKIHYWPLTGPLRILVFLDASFRNNDDGSSQRGTTVFLAESRERSSKDGMSYGSLVDNESQKVEKNVLSTTVPELYSFVKCFGSCQLLCGLWMDLSGEVAHIHMKTDAKNQVTTARTIHFPEHKETIHITSVLRKEACSGSVHDLAHIPTKKCLADCLTNAPAKADNLITGWQTGKLIDVDIHPDFENPYGAPGLLGNLVQNIITHKRKGSLPREQTLSIFRVQTSQEGPFQVMIVGGIQQKKEQNISNTRKRKGQDTPAESCIQFPWSVMPISMTTLTWMVRNIPN